MAKSSSKFQLFSIHTALAAYSLLALLPVLLVILNSFKDRLTIFATPFAFLFMMGYGFVAWLVASEQLGQRLAPRADAEPVSTESLEGVQASDASIAGAI